MSCLPTSLRLCPNRVLRSGAVGLQVYLKTCRAQHGAATLSCKPKTGHHTKGLATACISSKCALPVGSNQASTSSRDCLLRVNAVHEAVNCQQPAQETCELYAVRFSDASRFVPLQLHPEEPAWQPCLR